MTAVPGVQQIQHGEQERPGEPQSCPGLVTDHHQPDPILLTNKVYCTTHSYGMMSQATAGCGGEPGGGLAALPGELGYPGLAVLAAGRAGPGGGQAVGPGRGPRGGQHRVPQCGVSLHAGPAVPLHAGHPAPPPDLLHPGPRVPHRLPPQTGLTSHSPCAMCCHECAGRNRYLERGVRVL